MYALKIVEPFKQKTIELNKFSYLYTFTCYYKLETTIH